MQVLDLRSWTWSKVEVKAGESASPVTVPPCAGHSLVSMGDLSSLFYSYGIESSDIDVCPCRLYPDMICLIAILTSRFFNII